MTDPVSVLADGMLKVAYVTAIAGNIPTAAELTAGTTIDLTAYCTADGFTPGGDEQVISDDRLSTVQSYEKPGRFTDTLTIKYVYRAQDAAGTDNKAFATLKRGVTGFIVARWGKDNTTAFAIGDVLDVLPIQCGKQMKLPPEANSVLKIEQRLFITNAARRDLTVAA
jgi:hypothetical protein